MSRAWLSSYGRFVRRIVSALLWLVLLLAAVIVINVIGIQLFGSIADWQNWINEHAGYFLFWRLLLYAGTICAWIWLHQRLLTREPGTTTQRYLLRTEIAAVLALITLEFSVLLQSR